MNTLFSRLLKSVVRNLSPQQQSELLANIYREQASEQPPTYRPPEHYEYWERQIRSWGRHAYPVVPTGEELDRYEQEVIRAKNRAENTRTRVLILGATPQVRDVCAKHRDQLSITVADYSFRMITGMLQYAQLVDPMVEQWVRADWLDLPLAEQHYDCIVGDLAMQQIEPRYETQFLQGVRDLLTPGGVFVTRLHYIPSNVPASVEEIVSFVLSQPLSEARATNYLKMHLLWKFTDGESRQLRRTAARESLELTAEKLAVTDNPVVQAVLRSFRRYEFSFRRWAPPQKDELHALLKTSFDDINYYTMHHDPLAPYYPVGVLR